MSDPLAIQLPLASLPGVGSIYQERFEKLGIYTLDDLLEHYPVRYQDLSEISLLSEAKLGVLTTFEGELLFQRTIKTKKGLSIQKAVFTDPSGSCQVTWFNQPYLATTLGRGVQVRLTGKLNFYRHELTLSSPQWEKLSPDAPSLHTGRVVPIYQQTKGVTSKFIRYLLNRVLNGNYPVPEVLPPEIISRYGLTSREQALQQIHFPESESQYRLAKKTLAFTELYLYQLLAQKLKSEWSASHQSTPLSLPESELTKFLAALPFDLTSDQQKVINQVLSDLSRTQAMNRLVQGDVGSGKTIIAAVAALASCYHGKPAIIMVPTEVLANQHFSSFKRLFKTYPYQIALQTGKTKPQSDADIIIGTHALLHRQLPAHYGVVVIDEQHRFGVDQRSKLIDTSPRPHLLTLTATPIPRTIALTLYAQLDISTIKTMPPGRKTVTTRVVDEPNRSKAYTWLKKKLRKGSQIFVVCPLIQDSSTPKLDQVKAATSTYEELQSVFPEFKLALLHGRMPHDQKQTVISDFASRKIHILVATPVIEVGIDIPSADIILIESSERFGLASLHQLRGRVGRGDKQSYCLLFTSSGQEASRLSHLENTHSGLKLALLDMKLRGPGNFFGTQQSGFINLKLASLSDLPLIKSTHQAALSTYDQVLSDPSPSPLKQKFQSLLEKTLAES